MRFCQSGGLAASGGGRPLVNQPSTSCHQPTACETETPAICRWAVAPVRGRVDTLFYVALSSVPTPPDCRWQFIACLQRNQLMSWQSGLEHCLRPDEPMAEHCWLRLGGPAEFFAEPANEEDLLLLITRCQENDITLRTIGGGSNVLIDDKGVRGVVLSLATPAFVGVTVEGQQLHAGGGVLLSHAIVSAVREGLAGLEPLVSIPGTVGGALHGNAGGRTTSVGSCFQQATVITRSGELLTRSRDDVAFAYRQSELDELAIVNATFQLEPEDKTELTRRMQKQWIVMRSEQPSRDRRTALMFKDPMGRSAGELIDQAGLKGVTVGAASLYERDPNYVVVADDQGTSHQVRQLMDQIREQVDVQTGIDLEPLLDVW